MPAGRGNRARCSRPLLQPFARASASERRTHALARPFACCAENPSVAARHSTRTSPSASSHAQGGNVFAAEAQALGRETPRDQSKLPDRYARSLTNARTPSLHRIPPAMQQRASRAACWRHGWGPPRPTAAATGRDSPFSGAERGEMEGRNEHFLRAVRRSPALSKPLFRHKSI